MDKRVENGDVVELLVKLFVYKMMCLVTVWMIIYVLLFPLSAVVWHFVYIGIWVYLTDIFRALGFTCSIC